MVGLWIVAASATEGTVTVPLSDWTAAVPPPTAAPAPAAFPIRRELTGRLERGQLESTLVARFEVRGAAQAVPVLGAGTTLIDATLDGRPAALREDAGQWVVDAAPGVHELRAVLVHGARTDRFARQLDVPLPGGGPTAVDLVIPEAPIAPDLRSGVLTAVEPAPGGTRIRGYLAGGDLALTWERRAAGPVDAGAAHVDARTDAVLSLGDDVVTGSATVALSVREGEIDRVVVELPPELEVLDAAGPDVLQWHTDVDGALVVLLRQVADADAAATVRFQYPVRPEEPVPLRVPRPRVDGRSAGTLGVVAPVGVDVQPGEVRGGHLLEPRDVPASVLALTEHPLRAAVAYEGPPPDASVAVERQADLGVSASRVDDLQGITVLMEDGTEVGKLRLAVRNTARQVLTVDLPEGAVLTHCFRDGVPLLPAATPDRPERVLVPLTRSLQVERAEQEHVVAAGDMLSAIAQRYYGDGSRWRAIAAANPEAEGGLHPGQRLRIPPIAEVPAEAAFVLELGWERRAQALGLVGLRRVALPALDLEVMAANWHLYLPDAVQPVWVEGLGVAPDLVYTDPVHRLLDAVVSSAVPGEAAYAGGGYESALAGRRSAYLEAQQAQAGPVGDAFPLVGRKIRLHGVLLGTAPPAARIGWIGAPVAGAVRWLVLAAVAGVAFAAARWPRRWEGWVAALVGVGAVLVLGHHLLGVYQRAVWGVALGLLVALAARRHAGAAWVPLVVPRPGCVLAAVAPIVALWVLLKPPMLPIFAAVALAVAHWRHR